MRYFLIAGEASGDLHGANLIRGLKKTDKSAEIFCRGGNLMEEAGGKLLSHYGETAVMGYVDVLINLKKVLRSLNDCKKHVEKIKPDVIILIDYPGFNMKMAAHGRKLGIAVYYYISPKVWVWKKWRIKQIKRDVSRMYSILPFEKEFYAGYDFPVEYFGNPVVDQIERRRAALSDKGGIYESLGLSDKPVITLLAGSRKQEVKHILPAMVEITGYYPDYQFLLAASENITIEQYREIIGVKPIKVIYNKTYELLSIAEVAIVKSGTSTLEAALIGTPQVVCYRGGFISYLLARLLVRIRFISLVNLLMDREVVKELLQNDMRPEVMVKEINSIMRGGWRRTIMMKEYEELRSMMGEPGVSDRIASDMYKSLINSK
jgi:lipid-A-disaccharide synthase